MKLGRVGSPFCAVELYSVSLVGSPTSAALTAMRPANPMVCAPLVVMALLNGFHPSVNRATDGLPLASVVAVCVTERASSVLVAPPLSSTSSLVPDGLENVSSPANCAFNRATPEASPAEKSAPNTSSFGSAVAPSSSARTELQATRTLL